MTERKKEKDETKSSILIYYAIKAVFFLNPRPKRGRDKMGEYPKWFCNQPLPRGAYGKPRVRKRPGRLR